jgi:hypothetical protein
MTVASLNKLPPIDSLAWYTEPDSTGDSTAEVIASDSQQAASMIVKAALIETTASRGWSYVEKFAETVVRDLEAKALEEDDDAKAAGLRRDARGARKFKDELFKRIQMFRNLDNSDGFVEVVTD